MAVTQTRSVSQLTQQLARDGFVEKTVTIGGTQYSLWMKGCSDMNDSSAVYEFMRANARNADALRMYGIDSSTGKIGVTREGFAEVERDAIRGLATRYKRNADEAQRTMEAVEQTARPLGEELVRVGQGAVRTVASAFGLVTPTLTEEEKAQQAQARARRGGRTTVVAETAAGESSSVETAHIGLDASPKEAAPAEERQLEQATLSTKETIVINNYAALSSGKLYNLQVSYNPQVAGVWDGTMTFFVKHPECIYSFRWQQLGKEEWHNFRGGTRGKNFTNEYIELFTRPLTIRFLDDEGRLSVRLNLYLDLDSPQRAQIESLLASSQNLPETVRELMEKGYIRLYSEGEGAARLAGDRLPARIENLIREGFRPNTEYNF